MLLTADRKTTYEFVKGGALVEQRRKKDLETWEYNRALDEERVARMTSEQLARLRRGDRPSLFLPVPITVCRIGGRRFLMDGQHRLAVLAGLADHPGVSETEVLLCTVQCATTEELEDVFVRINSGTPVPAAYYAKKVNQVLGCYLEAVIAQYPLAVSDAGRPVRPHFNAQHVKDAMSGHLGLRDAIIDGRLTAEALLALTQKENGIEQGVQETPGAGKGLPERCLKGAAKTGFYLGLRKEWPVRIALGAVADLDDL